jgi:hypothetical protein
MKNTAEARTEQAARVGRAMTSTPDIHTRYVYVDGGVCFAIKLYGGAYFYSARERGYRIA